jgi:polyisoprenoid-binding protein YceI
MKANRQSKLYLPLLLLSLIAPAAATMSAQAPTGVPVFKITPAVSNVTFDVEASVAIEGTFKKWDATLTFTSPNATDATLFIKIDAASVDTGSGMKNSKLKSDDFFDVKKNPYITFKSTKVVQTGPNTFELDGDFTIRGVTKQEKLVLNLTGGKGTGHGTVTGTMAFDRKDYGMNSGIPFIKIANRVEVTVSLTADRTSGPPIVFKQ